MNDWHILIIILASFTVLVIPAIGLYHYFRSMSDAFILLIDRLSNLPSLKDDSGNNRSNK